MVAVRETSLNALDMYKKYFGETQETKVFEYILANPRRTRNDIAQDTGIKINAVCGRVNELIKKGVVIEGEKKKSLYGNSNVKSFSLHVKGNLDWHLVDTIYRKKVNEKMERDSIYRYAKVIRTLIANYEYHNKEALKVLMERDLPEIKDLFTLKKIVTRINNKYDNKKHSYTKNS